MIASCVGNTVIVVMLLVHPDTDANMQDEVNSEYNITMHRPINNGIRLLNSTGGRLS